MIMMRYILRSLNVLNGLLLAAIAAFVYFAVIPVLNPAARMSLPAVKGPWAPSVMKAEPYRTLAPGEYALVSDQTLFHPERKIPPEKPVDRAVPKPDLFLHGTLITGEGSFAFVEDRKATPSPGGGRDKRQLTLRKGATLGGYLLSEVQADRIVLVKGEDRVVVMLNDGAKRRAADASMPQAASKAASGAVSPAPAASSLPKTNASAAPGIGQIVPRSPQSPVPLPKSQTAAPSEQQAEPARGPGIGASGVWPPTRSTVEQTRQKLQEAQQIRREQLQNNPPSAP